MFRLPTYLTDPNHKQKVKQAKNSRGVTEKWTNSTKRISNLHK
jgi:hypothetical protein